MNDHIHTPGDGRGRRRVFMNGNEVDHIIWADTKRGVLIYSLQPFRLHKNRRDEFYSRKLRGAVTVKAME